MVSRGGGDEIGASCQQLCFPAPMAKNGYISILVDSGMRPIPFTPENQMRIGPDLRNVEHVDFVLLTHFHRDHSNYAPMVFLAYPNVVFVMTQPTADIVYSQLVESIHFMKRAEEEFDLQPLFTMHDVNRLYQSVRIIKPWERFWLSDDLSVLPIGAGHVLGAVSYLFDYQNGKKTVCHTGDFSLHDQRLIRGADSFKLRKGQIGTFLCESTYLGTPHINREKEKERFLDYTRAVLKRNGKLLVPTPKYHKTQDIHQMFLENNIPPYLIFIDGGGAEDLFEVYSRYTPIIMPDRGNYIRSMAQREKVISEFGPRIIIAHGMMLQARSPAFKCLRMIAENENNGVAVNSYNEPCSPGSEILAHVRRGQPTIQLDDEELELNCSFHKFTLSSHAGGDEIEALAHKARDQVVFHHGERRRVTKHLAGGSLPRAIFPRNGKEVAL